MQTATSTPSAVSTLYDYHDATLVSRVTAGLFAALAIFLFRYLLIDLSILLDPDAREQSWRQELLLLNLDPSSSLANVTPLMSNTFLGLLGLVSVFSFGAWIYRVSANSMALQQATRFTPFWAVTWFVVPIFNLWKPFQVMKELLSRNGDQMGGTGQLLSLWWTPHLLVVFPLSLGATTADEISDVIILEAQFRAAQEVIGIAMLVLAACYVLRLTGLQQRAAAVDLAAKALPQV